MRRTLVTSPFFAPAVALGIAVALPAAASARPATAPAPLVALPDFVGFRPACAVTADADATATDVRPGEVVTVSASYRVQCPALLAGRAALLVVGAVPSGGAGPFRDGLGAIVDAVAAAGGSRVALLLVARDPHAEAWATTPESLAALAASVRATPERPNVPDADWTPTLAEAERVLAAVPQPLRPLLVVVDGQDRAADAGGQPTRVVRDLAHAVRDVGDRAGHAIVATAEAASWPLAVRTTLGPTVDLVATFAVRSPFGLAAALQRVLAAYQAPLDQLSAQMNPTPEDRFALVAAEPATTLDEVGHAHWSWPASGHEASTRLSITLRLEGGERKPDEIVSLGISVGHRRAGLLTEIGFATAFDLCVQPPAPAPPVPCGGPAPTETAVLPPPNPSPPRPNPTRTPRPLPTAPFEPAHVWLPWARR